jgi:co-chaperonin GroES (HSP10)
MGETMEYTPFKPLFDKILVRRNPAPETIGVVVVPDEAKQPQSVGEVIMVGEGRLNSAQGAVYPLRVYPGCQVMFGPFSGVQVPELGEDLVLLREDELLAFSEPVPPEGD